MHIKYFLWWFILGLLPLNTLRAQYYLSGQDPASQRWMQLKTNDFTIIFPKGGQAEAFRISRLLQATYPALRTDFGAKPKPTKLIMHPQSVISNATAAWAPRRLDFYHTSPQDGYSQDWMKQLSLHELRHIVQFSALEKGFGKFVRLVSGQQGTAGIMGVFVPLWFIEGDAVLAETMYSSSGRGRQSTFLAGLRAQLGEMGAYSYNKAVFGSYKDHVPDVYELGYAMVAHNRQRFGEAIWSSAIDRTARRPWQLNPFSGGLRAISGMNKNKLYQSTMAAIASEGKNMMLKTKELTLHNITSATNYTNFRSPHALPDGSVIAIRKNLEEIPAIVRLTDSSEQVLVEPGILLHDWISVSDSLVVWSEYRPDPRWSNRSFAVIMLAELRSGIVHQLTAQSALFAPDLSPDGRRVVAVKQLRGSGSGLMWFDAASGRATGQLLNDSLSLLTPQWHPNGQWVYFAAIGNHGKALFRTSVEDPVIEQLTPFTYTNFSLSDVTNDGLLLAGDWSGVSSLYLLPFGSDSLINLTEARFAQLDPMFDSSHQRLIFSDYAATGYGIKALDDPFDDSRPTISFLTAPSFPLADALSHDAGLNVDTVTLSVDSAAISPYRKAAHLFNFHSWSPVYIDVNNQDFAPGLSLFSQNVLSTMVTELGYRWDRNEQTGKYVANVSYLGFYPELGLGVSHGLRKGRFQNDGKLYDLKWKETDWSVSAAVPLNLSRGKWLRGMQPTVSFRQINRRMEPGMPLEFKDPVSEMFSYGFSLYSQHRRAHRDLFPRWGAVVQGIYRHAPFDDTPGSQFYAGAIFYAPGFFRHHGFRMYAAYQDEREGSQSFGNLISIPRAYEGLYASRQISLKLDYAFPVAYPEWDIPALFYMKRITGRLFTDLMQLPDGYSAQSFLSAGAELHTESYFFNFPAPVNIGFRVSYRNEWGDIVPELIFGINFDALN